MDSHGFVYRIQGITVYFSKKIGKPLIIYFVTIKIASWVEVLVAIISFIHKFYLLENPLSQVVLQPTSHAYCRTFTCMHNSVSKITKMNMLSTLVTRDFCLWCSFIFLLSWFRKGAGIFLSTARYKALIYYTGLAFALL